MKIRLAITADLSTIMKLMDTELRNAGMGFVGSNQIKTEIRKKTVWIAEEGSEIVGVRIGSNTLYNLLIKKDHRGKGIGTALISVLEPDRIRVKAIPVGHLSKTQRQGFIDPRPFYEKLGYKFFCWLKAKNFWAGQKGKKRIYYSESKEPHIALYEHQDPLRRFKEKKEDYE